MLHIQGLCSVLFVLLVSPTNVTDTNAAMLQTCTFFLNYCVITQNKHNSSIGTHVEQSQLEPSLVENKTGCQLGQAYPESHSAQSKPGMQL